MKPTVVVDVGNTRIKWGKCGPNSISATASLPPDCPDAWAKQLADWHLSPPVTWAVSSVHPERGAQLVQWLRNSSGSVWLLDDALQLPLRVNVEYPNHVGIDRLLNAVAANSRAALLPNVPGQARPMVVIDAGSAVTVDLIDAAGGFRGGAIFPGLRLMAQALHDHTALLPNVSIQRHDPPLPGRTTPEAIEAGVYHAVAGGILLIVERYCEKFGADTLVFLTGGDADLLRSMMNADVNLWPEMTLEGLRRAAEAQP